MAAQSLLGSEARLAADHLARAEAWIEEVAPELQPDIARIRALLLHRAASACVPPAAPSRLGLNVPLGQLSPRPRHPWGPV
jgi:hypothetical protein